MKDVYDIIIEKQPQSTVARKTANSNSGNEATTENSYQNCAPFGEEQYERNAGTKAPYEEELFRRPQMVQRQLSQKQSNLDPADEKPFNHTKLSTNLSGWQRNKKFVPPVPPVNKLLESYMAASINRTNSVPLESSSSLSRRKEYRKEDFCNESSILKELELVDQLLGDLNQVSSLQNETFAESNPTSLQPNADENDHISSHITESDRNVDKPDAEVSEKLGSAPSLERNEAVVTTDDDGDHVETQNRSSSSNEAQHAASSKSDSDDETNDSSPTNHIDQQNNMSMKHSTKQAREIILEDWSDCLQTPSENEDNNTEKQVRPNIKKKPSAESKDRQVRSEIQKNDATTLKRTRRGGVCKTVQQIEDDEASTGEEDEFSINSLGQRVRPIVIKKSKIEPVISTQQREVIEEEYSGDSKPIVEKPSTRRLRKKNPQVDVEKQKIEPSNIKSRLRKRRIENGTVDTIHPTSSTTKSNTRQSRKRKHESVAQNDASNNHSSLSNAKKRKKLSKWEKSIIVPCNLLQPREVAPGTRHSTRERRRPENKLLLTLPLPSATSNRLALQRKDTNVQPQRVSNRCKPAENAFSMLMNGTAGDRNP